MTLMHDSNQISGRNMKMKKQLKMKNVTFYRIQFVKTIRSIHKKTILNALTNELEETDTNYCRLN